MVTTAKKPATVKTATVPAKKVEVKKVEVKKSTTATKSAPAAIRREANNAAKTIATSKTTTTQTKSVVKKPQIKPMVQVTKKPEVSKTKTAVVPVVAKASAQKKSDFTRTAPASSVKESKPIPPLPSVMTPVPFSTLMAKMSSQMLGSNR